MFGCNAKFYGSGGSTTLSGIQSLETGQLRFEEKYGIIIVYITDPYLDCHSFELIHDGVTKNEALQILKEKQNELKQKNPNQRVDLTVKTPVESGKAQGTAGHP